MRTHRLKTWPAYFDAVQSGEKTFEVRKDDRGFQKGDELEMIRFDPNGDYFYLRCWPSEEPVVKRTVSWILTGGQHGIEPGYVVMSFEPSP